MSDTSQVTSSLDVLSKYESLVSTSLGANSVYIRAKETIQELVSDGSIDDAQKATIISGVIGSAVGSITNASMSAALEWSKYEKELELKKLELDQQLLILAQDENLKKAQVSLSETQRRATVVESKRMYGTGTFDVTTGALTNLSGEGKVFNDMALVSQQTINAGVEETLLGSKIKESEVAIHKVVADTYVNYGSYTFTQGATGITSVTPTHGSFTTLSETQKDIAIEQGKGYAYNAWANALTGSASMLGTAIASDYFDFAVGSTGDVLLKTVLSCAENLQAADTVSVDAIPTAI